MHSVSDEGDSRNGFPTRTGYEFPSRLETTVDLPHTLLVGGKKQAAESWTHEGDLGKIPGLVVHDPLLRH
jgi:hypothetical protein